jgi:hypothetical protein
MSKVAETAEKSTLPNQASQQSERQIPTRSEDPPPKPETETPDTTDNSATPTTPEPNTGDLPDEDGRNSGAPGGGGSVPTFEERLRDPTAYRQDKSAEEMMTPQQAQVGGVSKWAATLTSTPEDWKYPGFKISIQYQLACEADSPELDPLPENGTLGIVVDEYDQVLDPPKAFDSSGYSLLDEQAEAEILEQLSTLPTRTKPTAYLLEFEVLLDCQGSPQGA